MSIRDEIQSRVTEGRLFHLPHALPGVQRVRTLFVTEELGRIVLPPWDATPEGLRFSRLRAQLDAFTAGGLISVAQGPFTKSKATYMGSH